MTQGLSWVRGGGNEDWKERGTGMCGGPQADRALRMTQ